MVIDLNGVSVREAVRNFRNEDLFDVLTPVAVEELSKPTSEYDQKYDRERNLLFLTSILTLDAKNKSLQQEMNVLAEQVKDLSIELERMKQRMRTAEVTAWERMQGEMQDLEMRMKAEMQDARMRK